MINLDVLFLCHCLIMLWYQPKSCFNFAQNFFKYKCLLFSNRLQVLMYLCMLHCSMYYYCCHVALPMTVSQCTVAVVAAVVVAAAWVWYGMEIENVKLCVDWLTGQRGLAAWDCDWGMIFGGASCACLTRWHTRLQKQSLMKIFSFRYGSLALEEEQSASSAQAGQSQFSSSPH